MLKRPSILTELDPRKQFTNKYYYHRSVLQICRAKSRGYAQWKFNKSLS